LYKKNPTTVENGQKMCPYGATHYQKVDFFAILEATIPPLPRAPISMKFCMAKWTHVPLRCAKFHMNLCYESPLWGENADFWPLSKNNTGSLPLCGNPASKIISHHQ